MMFVEGIILIVMIVIRAVITVRLVMAQIFMAAGTQVIMMTVMVVTGNHMMAIILVGVAVLTVMLVMWKTRKS